MLDQFKGFIGFFRGLYSEENGTPSSSRWHTGWAILAAIFWVTWIVFKTLKLPDFNGVALFIGVVSGLTYTAGKLITKFGGKDDKTGGDGAPQNQ